MFTLVFTYDDKQFTLTTEQAAHLLGDTTGNVRIAAKTILADGRLCVGVKQACPASIYDIVIPIGGLDLLRERGVSLG